MTALGSSWYVPMEKIYALKWQLEAVHVKRLVVNIK